MLMIHLRHDLPPTLEFQQRQVIRIYVLAFVEELDLHRRRATGNVYTGEIVLPLVFGGVEFGIVFPFFHTIRPGGDRVFADVLPVGGEDGEIGVEAGAHGFWVEIVEGAIDVGFEDQRFDLFFGLGIFVLEGSSGKSQEVGEQQNDCHGEK